MSTNNWIAPLFAMACLNWIFAAHLLHKVTTFVFYRKKEPSRGKTNNVNSEQV